MLMLKKRVSVSPPALEALSSKLYCPLDIGVPSMTPLARTVRPGGRYWNGGTVHVMPTPPAAATNPVYGVPTLPTGRLMFVTDNDVTAIVSCRTAKLPGLPDASTRTTNVNVPDVPAGGVPLSTPLDDSDRPGGRARASPDHVYADAQQANSGVE